MDNANRHWAQVYGEMTLCMKADCQIEIDTLVKADGKAACY